MSDLRDGPIYGKLLEVQDELAQVTAERDAALSEVERLAGKMNNLAEACRVRKVQVDCPAIGMLVDQVSGKETP